MITCSTKHFSNLLSASSFSLLFQWVFSLLSSILWRYRYIYFLSGICVCPFIVQAETVISVDRITENTVWTKEQSPYVLTKAFEVPEGITLTWESGVTIQAERQGYIHLKGKLNSQGTADEPVVFTSRNSSQSEGSHIVVSTESDGMYMRMSDGSNIEYGIWLSDAEGGRSGGGFIGAPSFRIGDPALPEGSHLEILVTNQQIDGSCSTPTYTGTIENDFSCALDFADTQGIEVLRYPAPSGTLPGDYARALIAEQVSKVELSHTMFEYGGGAECDTCSPLPVIEMRGGYMISSFSTFKDIASTGLLGEGNITLFMSGNRFLRVPKAIDLFGGQITIHGSSFIDVDEGIIVHSPESTLRVQGNWWGDARGPRLSSSDTSTTGALYSGTATVSPWLQSEPDNLVQHTASTTPVIIIPGLLGSLPQNGVWTLDPILHTYDNLIDTLIANGYVLGQTLFPFPYNWEGVLGYPASDLWTKIAEVKSLCNCPKVDIIGHSMGGLVARTYGAMPWYGNDIRKVIFLGTPHRGAPESYLLIEGGELRPSLYSSILKIFLTLYAKYHGYSNIYNYVNSFTLQSVFDLLPIYNYLIDKDTEVVRSYPDGYPRNYFLEFLQDSFEVFKNTVDITDIIGNTGTNTLSHVIVSPVTDTEPWLHGKPSSYVYSEGDDTVPAISSSTMPRKIVVSASHNDLPTAAEDVIVHILSGKNPTQTVHRRRISRIVTALIKPPASVTITAPSGAKIGAGDINEIPHAFYSGDINDVPGAVYWGNEGPSSIISIPDPEIGTYTIDVQDTAVGDYRIDLSDASEQNLTQSSFSSTIVSGVSTVAFAVTPDHVSDIMPLDELPPIPPAPEKEPIAETKPDITERHEVLPAGSTSSGGSSGRSRRAIPVATSVTEPMIVLGVSPDVFAQAYISASTPKKPTELVRVPEMPETLSASAFFAFDTIFNRITRFVQKLLLLIY